MDDKLHAQILQAIVEFQAPQILVLCTGDGNNNSKSAVAGGSVDSNFLKVGLFIFADMHLNNLT